MPFSTKVVYNVKIPMRMKYEATQNIRTGLKERDKEIFLKINFGDSNSNSYLEVGKVYW